LERNGKRAEIMMDEYMLEMRTGAGCSVSAASAGHRKEQAREHETLERTILITKKEDTKC
jgi:hypothetical protein